MQNITITKEKFTILSRRIYLGFLDFFKIKEASFANVIIANAANPIRLSIFEEIAKSFSIFILFYFVKLLIEKKFSLFMRLLLVFTYTLIKFF